MKHLDDMDGVMATHFIYYDDTVGNDPILEPYVLNFLNGMGNLGILSDHQLWVIEGNQSPLSLFIEITDHFLHFFRHSKVCNVKRNALESHKKVTHLIKPYLAQRSADSALHTVPKPMNFLQDDFSQCQNLRNIQIISLKDFQIGLK